MHSTTGLEPLHEITQIRPYMLRVEITTKDNETFFSEYKQIRVASETKHYRSVKSYRHGDLYFTVS